jgi:hypothetical protein
VGAPGTPRRPRTLEVKTVRKPIAYNQLADVKGQLVGSGLGKFANAGAGNHEVRVFASYSEAAAVTTAIGPFSRTESVNRDTHSFDRTSTKPNYGLRLRDPSPGTDQRT